MKIYPAYKLPYNNRLEAIKLGVSILFNMHFLVKTNRRKICIQSNPHLTHYPIQLVTFDQSVRLEKLNLLDFSYHFLFVKKTSKVR